MIEEIALQRSSVRLAMRWKRESLSVATEWEILGSFKKYHTAM